MRKYLLTFVLILSIFSTPMSAFAKDGEGKDASGSEKTENTQSTEPTVKGPENNDDTTPPTINAAVNNGKLRVQAYDESGIKVIYVNGYEFMEPKDGIITIRLEKFESSMEYFTVAAMDNMGNKTEDYYLENPYWTDPETDDNSTADPAEELPADASATDPADATGVVLDHVITDADGYLIENNETYYSGENDPSNGREFYTITTENGKIFYLIIERTDNEEIVHFVTDITENDLLNVTENNSEVLPKNSIATQSGKPVTEIAIPMDNGNTIVVEPDGNRVVRDVSGNAVVEETPSENEARDDLVVAPPQKQINPTIIYVVGGVIFFIFAYYFKIVRPKKQGGFVEDEETEEETEEEVVAEAESKEEGTPYVYSREQSDKDFMENYDPSENDDNE